MFYYLCVLREMRHLHTGGSCPVVSGQGVCDYDRSWSLAGRVAQCCGRCAQFFVLLCNFDQNPAVLCAYIIYRYNYKLVINNTISNYLYCITLYL